MSGRRTKFEIYWEILVFCNTPRAFTGIINRCDINSKTGQEYLEFLLSRGYITQVIEDEKTGFVSTQKAEEYITLFNSLYLKLFDKKPGFKL